MSSAGKCFNFLGDGPVPKERFSVNVSYPGRSLDFCLTSFGIPVATSRLAEVVAEAAGKDLILVPLSVEGDNNYKILYTRVSVACLDESRSEVARWTTKKDRGSTLKAKEEEYDMVVGLHVDPDRIPPMLNVFRVREWNVALVVSDTVRLAMQSAGCTGALFEDIT